MVPEPKQFSAAWIPQEASASLPAFVVPRLLRIQSAAKYLSATTWQVETLLREKIIPSFVLGKRRVVDRLELDRYVERRNAMREQRCASGERGNRRFTKEVKRGFCEYIARRHAADSAQSRSSLPLRDEKFPRRCRNCSRFSSYGMRRRHQ